MRTRQIKTAASLLRLGTVAVAAQPVKAAIGGHQTTLKETLSSVFADLSARFGLRVFRPLQPERSGKTATVPVALVHPRGTGPARASRPRMPDHR